MNEVYWVCDTYHLVCCARTQNVCNVSFKCFGDDSAQNETHETKWKKCKKQKARHGKRRKATTVLKPHNLSFSKYIFFSTVAIFDPFPVEFVCVCVLFRACKKILHINVQTCNAQDKNAQFFSLCKGSCLMLVLTFTWYRYLSWLWYSSEMALPTTLNEENERRKRKKSTYDWSKADIYCLKQHFYVIMPSKNLRTICSTNSHSPEKQSSWEKVVQFDFFFHLENSVVWNFIRVRCTQLLWNNNGIYFS